MEKLDAFKTALRGKKTYLAVAIGALYMLGVWAGAWEWDEKVLYAVGLGGLAFLRAALGGASKPNQTNGTSSLNALMLALLLGLMMTGCVSNPAGRVLVTTADTVDAAMQGWAQYVATGQATAGDELAVRDAYGKYQVAMRAARKAYAAAYKAGDVNAFSRAAEALKGSRQELLALVQKLQQKPAPQAIVNPTPMWWNIVPSPGLTSEDAIYIAPNTAWSGQTTLEYHLSESELSELLKAVQ